MALLSSKILNGLKGKIEKLVFYCARGQQRVRALAELGPRPRSQAMELQSCRLRACIAFYRANLLTELPRIWKCAAEGMVATGYNLFLGNNMRVFDRQHRITDYAALKVTTGSLELPTGWSTQPLTPRSVRIAWHNVLPEDASHRQDALMGFWLPDDGSFQLLPADFPGITRQKEEMTVTLPLGDVTGWHLYLFLTNADRCKYSDCQYFYFENGI